jgi:hypothetical protein
MCSGDGTEGSSWYSFGPYYYCERGNIKGKWFDYCSPMDYAKMESMQTECESWQMQRFTNCKSSFQQRHTVRAVLILAILLICASFLVFSLNSLLYHSKFQQWFQNRFPAYSNSVKFHQFNKKTAIFAISSIFIIAIFETIIVALGYSSFVDSDFSPDRDLYIMMAACLINWANSFVAVAYNRSKDALNSSNNLIDETLAESSQIHEDSEDAELDEYKADRM